MKIYLFDFDGTLVDSMPSYISVMLRILDDENIKYGNDIIKTITPLGFKGTAEYYQKLGVSLSIEELGRKLGAYAIHEYTYNIPAKKNVETALRTLKAAGASLNVLTASPHITLDLCLKRLGLFDMFDNVWSCDDFGTTKADPEIYRSAAKKLGCDVSEVVFLDDNYNALMTARSAGMRIYGVYDSSSEEDTDDIKAISERYISDFSELI